jgi:hypothetical protein
VTQLRRDVQEGLSPKTFMLRQKIKKREKPIMQKVERETDPSTREIPAIKTSFETDRTTACLE